MLAAYRLLLRSSVTRGRVVGLVALGVGVILLGLLLGSRNRSDLAYDTLVQGLGLTLLAPVVALVFAVAALGDPAEDRWLVHLWLTPISRWKLALAALGASLTVAVPLTALPVVAATALAGAPTDDVVAAAAGSVLAVLGYACIFVPLGFRSRRALAWGLAYALIWEGAVARVAQGAARISIGVHVRSLVAEIAGRAPPRNAVAGSTAVAVMAAVTVVGVLVTTWWLRRTDIA